MSEYRIIRQTLSILSVPGWQWWPSNWIGSDEWVIAHWKISRAKNKNSNSRVNLNRTRIPEEKRRQTFDHFDGVDPLVFSPISCVYFLITVSIYGILKWSWNWLVWQMNCRWVCGDDDGGCNASTIFIPRFQSDTETNWWHCPKMHTPHTWRECIAIGCRFVKSHPFTSIYYVHFQSAYLSNEIDTEPAICWFFRWNVNNTEENRRHQFLNQMWNVGHVSGLAWNVRN